MSARGDVNLWDLRDDAWRSGPHPLADHAVLPTRDPARVRVNPRAVTTHSNVMSVRAAAAQLGVAASQPPHPETLVSPSQGTVLCVATCDLARRTDASTVLGDKTDPQSAGMREVRPGVWVHAPLTDPWCASVLVRGVVQGHVSLGFEVHVCDDDHRPARAILGDGLQVAPGVVATLPDATTRETILTLAALGSTLDVTWLGLPRKLLPVRVRGHASQGAPSLRGAFLLLRVTTVALDEVQLDAHVYDRHPDRPPRTVVLGDSGSPCPLDAVPSTGTARVVRDGAAIGLARDGQVRLFATSPWVSVARPAPTWDRTSWWRRFRHTRPVHAVTCSDADGRVWATTLDDRLLLCPSRVKRMTLTWTKPCSRKPVHVAPELNVVASWSCGLTVVRRDDTRPWPVGVLIVWDEPADAADPWQVDLEGSLCVVRGAWVKGRPRAHTAPLALLDAATGGTPSYTYTIRIPVPARAVLVQGLLEGTVSLGGASAAAAAASWTRAGTTVLNVRVLTPPTLLVQTSYPMATLVRAVRIHILTTHGKRILVRWPSARAVSSYVLSRTVTCEEQDLPESAPLGTVFLVSGGRPEGNAPPWTAVRPLAKFIAAFHSAPFLPLAERPAEFPPDLFFPAVKVLPLHAHVVAATPAPMERPLTCSWREDTVNVWKVEPDAVLVQHVMAAAATRHVVITDEHSAAPRASTLLHTYRHVVTRPGPSLRVVGVASTELGVHARDVRSVTETSPHVIDMTLDPNTETLLFSTSRPLDCAQIILGTEPLLTGPVQTVREERLGAQVSSSSTVVRVALDGTNVVVSGNDCTVVDHARNVWTVSPKEWPVVVQARPPLSPQVQVVTAPKRVQITHEGRTVATCRVLG